MLSRPPASLRFRPLDDDSDLVCRTIKLRACLETTSEPAAGDFGCGQGGEVLPHGHQASPKRAVRNEPTQATGKSPSARRVFAPKATWLRCSSAEDPPVVFSRARAEALAPCHSAFGAKTGPLAASKQALWHGWFSNEPAAQCKVVRVKHELCDVCDDVIESKARHHFVNVWGKPSTEGQKLLSIPDWNQRCNSSADRN